MLEETAQKQTLLRAAEVACLLELCPEEVIRLADRGELRATKEGGFWRFRLKDVALYKSQERKKARASTRSSPS